MTYQSAADQIKARIDRWESLGACDPDCKFCQEHVYPALRENREPFCPPHIASKNCESGSRRHCSCDRCF